MARSFIASMVLGGVALAGCAAVVSAGAQVSADPCATAPQSCATVISAHGTAETRIANTAVDISVSVLATDKDLAGVQRAVAARSADLLGYLRGQKTQRLISDAVNFAPDTRSGKNAADRIVGYTATERVSFRTTPEKAPEILAAVLEHGANGIDSTAFTPTEEEVAVARRELSAQATKNALAEGEAIARAAGLRVAAVKTINVESGGLMPRPRMYAMAKMAMPMASAAPIDTASGDQSLTVQVDVTLAAIR